MAKARTLDVAGEFVDELVRCGEVNDYLLAVLPSSLWRAAPPRGRTIAAIALHMFSVRRTFLRMAGRGDRLPTLDRTRATRADVRRALRVSTTVLAELVATAFDERRGRIRGLPKRTVEFGAYVMQHDAHHRGQIVSLARTFGHEFSRDDVMRLWGWKAMPGAGTGRRGKRSPKRDGPG